MTTTTNNLDPAFTASHLGVMLSPKATCEITGFHKSTLWRKAKKGLFPPLIQISRNASRWPAHEVYAVQKAIIAGATEDELKALVAELVAQRKEKN